MISKLINGFNDFGDFIGPTLLFWVVFKILLSDYLKNDLKNYRIPPTFKEYILFLTLFILSLLWSKNPRLSFIYFSFFVTGGLFWFTAYNAKYRLKNFDVFIISLGILYAILTLLYILTGDLSEVKTYSLVKYAVAPLHHHHIGDLWAVVLIILAIKIKKRASKFLIIVGIFFLYLSLSRSAYLALIAGSLFLISRLKGQLEVKRILWIYIIVATALFLFASFQKSTILAHGGYLVQGVVGFINNPIGVGFGNFEFISKDPRKNLFGFAGGSSSAHNIILEIVAGMGILGLSFVYWIIKVLKHILKVNSTNALIYAAVFIALFANFFFDYTYLIPTMLWMWFLSLGLAQKREQVD